MKAKLKGAIIPYVVTVLWMIFWLWMVSSEEIFYLSISMFSLTNKVNAMCPVIYFALYFSVPWLFISLYSHFNKQDNSTQKYLIALSLLLVLVFCSFWTYQTDFGTFLLFFVCTFALITALCIGLLKLYHIVDKEKKAPYIKFLILFLLIILLFVFVYDIVKIVIHDYNINFLRPDFYCYYWEECCQILALFIFLLFTCKGLFTEYKKDEKSKYANSIFSGLGFLSVSLIIFLLILKIGGFGDFTNWNGNLLETYFMIANILSGIVFLIGYEFGGDDENSLLKYIIAIFCCMYFSRFSFSFFDAILFTSRDEISCVLSTLIVLIPIIVCFIFELSGKSITAAIAKAIKKTDGGDCGAVVHPEKSSELRSRARGQLGGRIFATAWLMMVLVQIIYGAINGFSAMTLIGGLLVGGPLSYGLTRVQARLVNESGYEVDLSDLFKGFSESFTQSLVLGFMKTLFTALWSILFVVPGIVKTYAYSMAFYIQQQSDDKNWKKALEQSQRLMNGNKMKLFLLDLSFIGWYILGSMCFGIGILFVYPYHMTARANFFDSLLKNSLAAAEETVSAEPEECCSIEETAAASADLNA